MDPANVSYIEAHGTGTPLGDPIEIEGLVRAFRNASGERGISAGSCAVGTIKSNIGHLEFAAGVAGVIKVLLQMRHRTIVPSLHCTPLNPGIKFEGSPFRIADQVSEWASSSPLTAGVSSFGFGGVNAHVVLKEYTGRQPESMRATGPFLVPLSARDQERLREKSVRLTSWLRDTAEADLPEIAYTLQVGRDALPARLAMVVRDREDLIRKLEAYAAGTVKTEDVYTGEADRDAMAAIGRDEDLLETLESWMARGKAGKLASIWTQGLDIDWSRLYRGERPRRCSLPGYPFARERHWIPEGVANIAAGATPSARLHPLVHRNTSDLHGQRYSTMLTGEEWFIREHRVDGRGIVPGVAQLEWARAAAALALGGDAASISLEQVAWLRPLEADPASEVHIGLVPEEDGRIGFTLYRENVGDGDDEIFCRGYALAEQGVEAGRPPDVRIGDGGKRLEGEKAYEIFSGLQLEYGPDFRVLREIRLDSEGDCLEAFLVAPETTTDGGYFWPPHLLDGALQAAIGFTSDSARLELPFAVDSVRSWGRVTGPARVVVTRRRGPDDTARLRDVWITDPEGRPLVAMRGLYVRPSEQAAESGIVVWTPDWQPQPAPTPGSIGSTATNTSVVVYGFEPANAPSHWHVFRPEAGSPASTYADCAGHLLGYVQAMVAGSREQSTSFLLQVVVPAEGEYSVLAGLNGLLRSAEQEHPGRLRCRMLAVASLDDLGSIMEAEAGGTANLVRYGQQGRETLRYKEVPLEKSPVPWRDNGVYWITGGFGGLGRLFVREAAHQARNPVLILSSRNGGSGQEAFLDELRGLGARVEAHSLDVADAAAVRSLAAQILEQHGNLNGIVHGAGVLQDGLLMHKQAESLHKVLSPKIFGLENLDAATADLPLDWIVACSSISAAWGNPGQSDYAAANGFMDAFAVYRDGLARQGLRHGRLVSVNWPLWAEGGMGLTPDGADALGKRTGMRAMPTHDGMQVLAAGLAHKCPVFLAAFGSREKLRSHMRALGGSSEARPSGSPAQAGYAGSIGAAVEKALTVMVSEHLQLPLEAVDCESPLSEFGFDSISLTSFGQTLNERYGLRLSPAVFFEAPTVASLAAYLAREHGEAFAGRLAPDNKQAARESDPCNPFERPLPEKRQTADSSRSGYRRRSRPRASGLGESASAAAIEPIAVIGMSGSFPGAPGLEAFWANLVDGRDCIGELPDDRWTGGRPPLLRHAGILDGIELFDPRFFGISPGEARIMDPQQRLLMRYVYHVVEDAGYSVRELAGSNTALLVATAGTGYSQLLARTGEQVTAFSAAALAASMGPNRMSYWLNWRGPSEPVETACSSSLVAIHKAIRLLRSGQCEQAVVGGINTILSMDVHESFRKAGMLSADGRCRAFSASAEGYVRGEGVGMLMLKPLSAARRDNDHIYGLVMGSAQNHGGKANSLTAPNPSAQAEVIQAAFRDGQIEPETVSYIEAHGTGTPLGDPVEVEGLRRAFRHLAQGRTLPEEGCGLGTVKSNIGHLELAAGVAGTIKTLLQMRHRTLAPSLHSEPLNPLIDFKNSPFRIIRQPETWESSGPLRAGVSSFGFGGVNAHVVLQGYEDSQPQTVSSKAVLPIVLSARDADRLREAAGNLAAHIRAHRDIDPARLACTLQTGREPMPERLALVVDDMDELAAKLEAVAAGETGGEGVFKGNARQAREGLASFSGDEAFMTAITTWKEREEADKLARLWVGGLDINWERLYPDGKPKRCSLPGYPFARERYWPRGESAGRRDLTVAGASGPEAGRMVDQGRDIKEPVTFEEFWQVAPLAEEEAGLDGTIVCIAPDAAAIEELRIAGASLRPSPRLIFILDSRVGPVPQERDVTLADLGQSPEFAGTLKRIAGSHGSIHALLDMRALISDFAPEAVELHLPLMRAIAEAGIPINRVLWAGHCRDDISQAYLESRIGLFRTASLILPETMVAPVIERASARTSFSGWLQRLTNELSESGLQDVLYREGQRHVCDVKELHPQVGDDAHPTFKERGVYWITGGAGGIGSLVAGHLAGRYRARLVISGRGPLDERRQALVESLEAKGASVLYVQADAADPDAVRAAYTLAKKRFGRVDGVIHAAGLAGREILLEVTLEAFRETLAAKVEGALALEQALGEEPIGFICHFASLAGILGDTGSGAYAAANRFLLALARLRQERSGRGESLCRTLAIAWPLWARGGMSQSGDESARLYLVSSGQRALENDEALLLLERLIAGPSAQPIVLAGEPSRMRRLLEAARIRKSLKGRAFPENNIHSVNAAGSGHEAESASLGERIVRDLTELTCKLAGLQPEAVLPENNLAEYGLDSIGLTELAANISARFGISLPPSIFFSYPGIGKLALYLEKTFAGRIASLYTPNQEEGEKQADAIRPDQQPPAPVRGEHDDVKHAGPVEPVAVIGLSGRFPGARDVDAFWELLVNGRSAIDQYPFERLGVSVEATPRKRRWLAAVPGIEEFDASFFSISPREAERMDPRQRLLLQEAWKALEDAAYGPDQLSRDTVGMFVGVENGDYMRLLGDAPQAENMTANHDAILASRLAYSLDLHGPVLAVNTACSSGLVALHQACQSLRLGECDAAVAAGVNLMPTPFAVDTMEEAGMLAPDGVCRAFDRRAGGMVPGEAVVAVVLKPFSKALRDGDPIHAVIAGSGINYDGRTQGITAPNGLAQVRLLTDVYNRCGVDAADIGYLVAHGTGTPLGDPVEVNALCEVFGRASGKKRFCALTSCKPNVGHSLAASGLVSLACLVQALKNGMIPASLCCEEPSTYVDWEESPFFINRENRPWRAQSGRPRFGAVSSFGMSGTNVHVVLRNDPGQDFPHQESIDHVPVLLAFSAKTAAALREKSADLARILFSQALSRTELRALSHTLLNGRAHFAHRFALIVQNQDEAARILGDAALGIHDESLFMGEVSQDWKAQNSLASLGEELLNRAAEQGENALNSLRSLAELYCQGYRLPWLKLYGDRPPKRIHAPTYPFARERHWVMPSNRAETSVALEPGGPEQTGKEANPDTFKNPVSEPRPPKTGLPVESPGSFPPVENELIPPRRWFNLLAYQEFQLAHLVLAHLDDMGWLEQDPGPEVQGMWRQWRKTALHILASSGVDTSAPPTPLKEALSRWDLYCESIRGEDLLERQLKLLNTVLPELPSILLGRRNPLELLFPDGKMDLLESIYREHPVSRHFNDILAGQAEMYVRERLRQDPDYRLRLLEIGAGTGGTSDRLFSILSPYADRIEEYAYTDLSAAFLQHAQNKYVGIAPYLSTCRLDIEKTPESQGFPQGGYDLVIAANVLHATRDMNLTLQHCGSLLRKNGLLLLNELAGSSMFTHLTFGLLEGWWLVEDRERRDADCPGLGPDQWRSALEDAGFDSVTFPAGGSHALGQQIVLARYRDVEAATSMDACPPLVTEPEETGGGVSLRQGESQPVAADYQDEAQTTMAGKVRELAAAHLKLPEASLGMSRPLGDFGFDSITLISFRHVLQECFGIELTVNELMQSETLSGLVLLILGKTSAAGNPSHELPHKSPKGQTSVGGQIVSTGSSLRAQA